MEGPDYTYGAIFEEEVRSASNKKPDGYRVDSGKTGEEERGKVRMEV